MKPNNIISSENFQIIRQDWEKWLAQIQIINMNFLSTSGGRVCISYFRIWLPAEKKFLSLLISITFSYRIYLYPSLRPQTVASGASPSLRT